MTEPRILSEVPKPHGFASIAQPVDNRNAVKLHLVITFV